MSAFIVARMFLYASGGTIGGGIVRILTGESGGFAVLGVGVVALVGFLAGAVYALEDHR